MSDPAADDSTRKIYAEIDRMLAETRKFAAEQAKLSAEREKRYAEADKYRRDRFLAPILAAGALGGAVAAILAIMTRSLGVR